MIRVLMIAAAVALAGCNQEAAPERGALQLQLDMLRAEVAGHIRGDGYPCDEVLGSDLNLTVCRVGVDVRVYRITGAGEYERVMPGPG